MEMEKTERGEESQPAFGEERRRRTLISLLFSPLFPQQKEVAAQGGATA